MERAWPVHHDSDNLVGGIRDLQRTNTEHAVTGDSLEPLAGLCGLVRVKLRVLVGQEGSRFFAVGSDSEIGHQ